MPNMLPIYAFTDSKSLCENINSTNQATDLKLRREVEGIRQHIQLGEISKCIWIPTALQLADCLTKNTAPPENLIGCLTSGELRFIESYV